MASAVDVKAEGNHGCLGGASLFDLDVSWSDDLMGNCVSIGQPSSSAPSVGQVPTQNAVPLRAGQDVHVDTVSTIDRCCIACSALRVIGSRWCQVDNRVADCVTKDFEYQEEVRPSGLSRPEGSP